MTMIAPEEICIAAAATPDAPALRRAFGRFRREEDGSLLIFGLFAFVMMLLLAGISLDLMRDEERRTTLQNTIDRAALAAADLQQSLDPKDVVRDYFQKAGLKPPAPEDIIVTEGTLSDYRKVEIKVSEDMPTWFMALVGVKTLSTPAASTAEESVGQIEISLILDVSGSMNSNSRLTNLKPAAKNFVDQIFDSAEEDKVSISIIPYATQVSIGDNLASYFNMTVEQTDSTCIEFEESEGDFTTTAMSFGTDWDDRIYQRNGHFDPFYKASPPNLMNCAPEAERNILPFSGSRTELKTFIDNLSAEGNTSIDIGMKWGSALLDPSMQGVVDGMIATGDIPAAFSERPYAYDDKEALKIIVLMTDGANTTEYRLRSDADSNPYYDEGQSLLYRNKYYLENASSSDNWSRDQYSLYNPSTHKYYSFKKSAWRDKPWGDMSGDTGYSGSPMAVPMDWPEVWSKMSIYYFSDEIIYRAYGSSSMRNQWRPASVSNPVANTYIYSAKDDLTLDICGAAKAEGVRIFTIAFEAPTQGQQLLNSCQNAGYYAVEGLDINDAFAGIVNSINKLRLTH